MSNLDSSEEYILEQIESALCLNDLQKASAIINRFEQKSGHGNPAIKKLHEKILKAQKSLDEIESLYKEGARFLERKEPEKAIALFKKVLSLAPDHAPARAGIQGARRYKEWRDKVDRLLAQAHDAESTGDFVTAKDRCEDVLKLAPDNVAAQGFLNEINHWISKRKQARLLIRQGERLFKEEKFTDAIQIWERISDVDPTFDDGFELILKAKKEIKKKQDDELAQKLLREAQHALDSQDFEYTLKLLESFPSESSFTIDAKVIKRKAEHGLESLEILRNLEEKVITAMKNNDLKNVEKYYHLILELNPLASIIEKIREFLGVVEKDA